jgi:general secretion pathway protein D
VLRAGNAAPYQAVPIKPSPRALALALCTCLTLAACATPPQTFHEGRELVEVGDAEQGLALIEEALKASPQDREIRNYYLRHRAVAVQRFLQLGENALAANNFDAAESAFQRALRFDPQNPRAQAGLEALARQRQAAPLVADALALMKAGDTDTAHAKAKEALSIQPRHREARAIVRRVEEARLRAEGFTPELTAALQKPITIELRDAPVRAVLELIAKRSGLNFVLDREVAPDLRTTVFVRDTPIEEVIRIVLLTSDLESRVLNESTILVYPNTPQKVQAYRQLVVRSFYLDNADVKQTANMVRSLVKTRDLYVDEALNLLVVRDSPEAIRMIERLIAAQDLALPEVMLEVELLEVGHSDLTQLGIIWPASAAIGVTGAAGIPGQITGTEARNFTGDLVRLTFTDPLVALSLRQLVGRTNVLANPRIRVRNRERARIHIGDKVPVVTTTAGATGFVAETVNYLDVGLKLEVEPSVHLEGDVGIRVALEVSNITSQVTSAAGTVAFQVGTRNAATVLRLRDGETQVLAGLISDEDRRAVTQVPGLARLPLLGRLFQHDNDTLNKTEVVLLITPRVVRNVERPGVDIEQFLSGSELEVGSVGGAPPAQPPMVILPSPEPAKPAPGPAAPPFGAPVPAPAPMLPPRQPSQ